MISGNILLEHNKISMLATQQQIQLAIWYPYLITWCKQTSQNWNYSHTSLQTNFKKDLHIASVIIF
jgi:hypothetical protein